MNEHEPVDGLREAPERWSDHLDHCAAVRSAHGLLRDGPFDLDVFTAELARMRDRPIHLTPIRLPSRRPAARP